MVRLYIIAEGVKINIELDSIDITLEELKKVIEKNMSPDKVIPCDKQTIFINKGKLADDKKLSDYIKDGEKEVKVFVLRKSNNVLSSNKPANNQTIKTNAPVNNQNNNFQSKNPYEGVQNLQMPTWGYPSPNQSFNQQFPPGFGYGSPNQSFSQMPPMNNLLSKENIEELLNSPQFLEQMVDMQTPGLSQPEKENMINLYRERVKMLQNDPNFMNVFNSMAQNMLKGGMMPPFPPQQPPSPYGYPPQYGMPPQQSFNPYIQQHPYYGYPPYGNIHPQGSPIQPPNNIPSAHYEAAYAPQLKALEDMGFTDKKSNLEALIRANGDINLALDYIRKDENFNND